MPSGGHEGTIGRISVRVGPTGRISLGIDGAFIHLTEAEFQSLLRGLLKVADRVGCTAAAV